VRTRPALGDGLAHRPRSDCGISRRSRPGRRCSRRRLHAGVPSVPKVPTNGATHRSLCTGACGEDAECDAFRRNGLDEDCAVKDARSQCQTKGPKVSRFLTFRPAPLPRERAPPLHPSKLRGRVGAGHPQVSFPYAPFLTPPTRAPFPIPAAKHQARRPLQPARPVFPTLFDKPFPISEARRECGRESAGNYHQSGSFGGNPRALPPSRVPVTFTSPGGDREVVLEGRSATSLHQTTRVRTERRGLHASHRLRFR